MSETPLPELQPASQNEWYKLATAGKDHTDNTRCWNGYMRHLVGEEEADNLKRADGTPICLPTLRSDEIEWITRNILGLPQEFLEEISLSGLFFAEAVHFQDFYFPVEAIFDESTFAGSPFVGETSFTGTTFAGNASFTGTTFAGNASFTGTTFAEYAYFEASTFKGPADFTRSTFEVEADFIRSIFKGPADFTRSTFKGPAYFEASTFAGPVNFTRSTFEVEADFIRSIFKGPADFTGSTFKGPADFSNSRYRGKTSFQKVIFTRAPLFFETTLHEDTDWTDVDWPDKPANKEEAIQKEDATQYVRRYDRLALVMSTLKQPDNEHRFFRLSMRAKEVRDGWGISTGLSRLYGLFFCYGWGLKRALGSYGFSIYSLVQVICGAWRSGR